MTPKQMRALADELQSAAAIDFGVSGDTMFAAQAALRAAADQLEALPTREQIERAVVTYGYDRAFTINGNCIDLADLNAYGKHVADTILTADTAPQEDGGA